MFLYDISKESFLATLAPSHLLEKMIRLTKNKTKQNKKKKKQLYDYMKKKHMTYLTITKLLDHPSAINVNCKHWKQVMRSSSICVR